jgi:hypothetical protein
VRIFGRRESEIEMTARLRWERDWDESEIEMTTSIHRKGRLVVFWSFEEINERREGKGFIYNRPPLEPVIFNLWSPHHPKGRRNETIGETLGETVDRAPEWTPSIISWRGSETVASAIWNVVNQGKHLIEQQGNTLMLQQKPSFLG